MGGIAHSNSDETIPESRGDIVVESLDFVIQVALVAALDLHKSPNVFVELGLPDLKVIVVADAHVAVKLIVAMSLVVAVPQLQVVVVNIQIANAVVGFASSKQVDASLAVVVGTVAVVQGNDIVDAADADNDDVDVGAVDDTMTDVDDDDVEMAVQKNHACGGSVPNDVRGQSVASLPLEDLLIIFLLLVVVFLLQTVMDRMHIQFRRNFLLQAFENVICALIHHPHPNYVSLCKHASQCYEFVLFSLYSRTIVNDHFL